MCHRLWKSCDVVGTNIRDFRLGRWTANPCPLTGFCTGGWLAADSGNSRSTESAETDLPEPDSPPSATVSAALYCQNEIWSTPV